MKGTTQERVTSVRQLLLSRVRPTMRVHDPHNDAILRALELIDDVFEVDDRGIVDGKKADQ